jgi:uncharacterized protein YijF (DUF1287 family)
MLTALAAPARAEPAGERLARAAQAQVGVTLGYDPAYVRIAYPGGDVPRATGVCADVVIRAARDGLGLDLQKLMHEDMSRAFAAYPSKRAWGLAGPDRNIDHRRVLNLQAYWRRQGAEVWRALKPTAGHAFPRPLEVGDELTWLVTGRRPHVGIVTGRGLVTQVVHNIGWGAQEVPLQTFAPFLAVSHFRWPRS